MKKISQGILIAAIAFGLIFVGTLNYVSRSSSGQSSIGEIDGYRIMSNILMDEIAGIISQYKNISKSEIANIAFQHIKIKILHTAIAKYLMNNGFAIPDKYIKNILHDNDINVKERIAAIYGSVSRKNIEHYKESIKIDKITQVITSIIDAALPKNTEKQAKIRYSLVNEERKIKIISIPFGSMQNKKAKYNDQELRDLYNKHIKIFTKPKHAKILYIDLNQNPQIMQIKVSQAEIAKKLKQVTKASKILLVGLDAANSSGKFRGKFEEMELSYDASSRLFGHIITSKLFSMNKGDKTPVLQHKGRNYKFIIKAIENMDMPSEDDVRENIMREKKRAKIEYVITVINTMRKKGYSINKISKRINMKVYSRTLYDGKQAAEIGVFDMKVGEISDAISDEDLNVTFIELQEIFPAHTTSFQDAKEQLTDMLRSIKYQDRARIKAMDYVRKINSGKTDLAQVAKLLNSKIRTTGFIKTNTKNSIMEDNTILRAFDTKKNSAIIGRSKDGHVLVIVPYEVRNIDIFNSKFFQSEHFEVTRISVIGREYIRTLEAYYESIKSQISVTLNNAAITALSNEIAQYYSE